MHCHACDRVDVRSVELVDRCDLKKRLLEGEARKGDAQCVERSINRRPLRQPGVKLLSHFDLLFAQWDREHSQEVSSGQASPVRSEWHTNAGNPAFSGRTQESRESAPLRQSAGDVLNVTNPLAAVHAVEPLQLTREMLLR